METPALDSPDKLSPLERAARALFEEAYAQEPVPPFGYADCEGRNTILDGPYDLKALARAVLTAIREPSEAHVRKVYREGAWNCAQDEVGAIHTAMIDAALAEEG